MKRIIIAAALILGLSAGIRAQETPRSDARADVEKWIETRRMIAREENDWRIGRELLRERLDLVAKEAVSLEERIAATRTEMAESEKKLAELHEQNDRIKAGMKDLGKDVRQLESRTLGLLDRTPEPVRERVRPLSQRIPVNPKETRMSLSERYQNIVGTLNELNKATRDLAVSGEVRQLAGGGQAEVSVFYIGLSQAYYCNAKSGVAGVGLLSPHGWVWQEDNTLAGTVGDVLGIYRNEKPAAYVGLPVKIQ